MDPQQGFSININFDVKDLPPYQSQKIILSNMCYYILKYKKWLRKDNFKFHDHNACCKNVSKKLLMQEGRESRILMGNSVDFGKNSI